jgi:hypothetical protein
MFTYLYEISSYFNRYCILYLTVGMEIEIAQEINRGMEFESHEKNASSFQKQLMTVSTVICVIQVYIYTGIYKQYRNFKLYFNINV